MTETWIKSDPKFNGMIVNLRVDEVSLPDGNRATREVVEHANVSVIVPIDQNKDVLFVKQYRYAAKQTLLELPAGLIEPNENPTMAAHRELAEETGYASRRLLPIGGFWSSPGFCTEYIHVFIAHGLMPNPLKPDDDEFIELVRRPVKEIPNIIRSGEIQDAKSIAALLMTILDKGPIDGI